MKKNKTVRDNAPTLRECDFCGGEGKTEVKSNILGCYLFKDCIWCEGVGCYTRERHLVYSRWRRIRIYWEKKGLCEKQKL